MSIVYIGIGSNLGNRQKNIDQAFLLMQESGIKILKRSSVIETEPVGGPPQGKFLNAAIEIETQLEPLELLRVLQNIEKKLGRIRTVVNGPRSIDLDILLYENVALRMPELTIPHPRMFEREFVLTPLREIAPQMLKEIIHASC